MYAHKSFINLHMLISNMSLYVLSAYNLVIAIFLGSIFAGDWKNAPRGGKRQPRSVFLLLGRTLSAAGMATQRRKEVQRPQVQFSAAYKQEKDFEEQATRFCCLLFADLVHMWLEQSMFVQRFLPMLIIALINTVYLYLFQSYPCVFVGGGMGLQLQIGIFWQRHLPPKHFLFCLWNWHNVSLRCSKLQALLRHLLQIYALHQPHFKPVDPAGEEFWKANEGIGEGGYVRMTPRGRMSGFSIFPPVAGLHTKSLFQVFMDKKKDDAAIIINRISVPGPIVIRNIHSLLKLRATLWSDKAATDSGLVQQTLAAWILGNSGPTLTFLWKLPLGDEVLNVSKPQCLYRVLISN